jgi:hypothetical protein
LQQRDLGEILGWSYEKIRVQIGTELTSKSEILIGKSDLMTLYMRKGRMGICASYDERRIKIEAMPILDM